MWSCGEVHTDNRGPTAVESIYVTIESLPKEDSNNFSGMQKLRSVLDLHTPSYNASSWTQLGIVVLNSIVGNSYFIILYVIDHGSHRSSPCISPNL